MSPATLTAAIARQAARLPSTGTMQKDAPEPELLKDSGRFQARWNHALNLMLLHRRSAAGEIDRLLKQDPGSVFGHCLRAALIVRGDDTAARWKLAASLAAIEGASPDPGGQARRHAAAARAWLSGNQLAAAELYGAIVIDWPRDILALAAAHAFDFRLSRRLMLRDRIAQVLPEWEPNMPGYASVLTMYAFGLEENGEYGRAEAIARRALAIEPAHPGAIHVIAHVMEMQGRAREGLAFLARTEPAWANDTGFSIHLTWHRALLYLEEDDVQSALAIYDSQLANGSVSDLTALADASALLWRLGLREMDLGDRWQLLADRWEMQPLRQLQPFYTVHAVMAFAAAKRTAPMASTFKSLPPVDMDSLLSSLREEMLAPWVCRAFVAFANGDYEACAEWLGRVRYIAPIAAAEALRNAMSPISLSLRLHYGRGIHSWRAPWWRNGQRKNPRVRSIKRSRAG